MNTKLIMLPFSFTNQELLAKFNAQLRQLIMFSFQLSSPQASLLIHFLYFNKYLLYIFLIKISC